MWLHRGPWEGVATLENRPVSTITSVLEPVSRASGKAHRLTSNSGKSFQGSNVNGIGFVLEPDEAEELLRQDPRNADVVFPYLNGEDLNSRPDCSASRWVINFFDWPLDRAMQYPACLGIIDTRVKPAREQLKNKPKEKQNYWLYERRAIDLYAAIEEMERVIAISLVSKAVAPAFVPVGAVFAHRLGVFPYDDDAHFGLLVSTVHYWWAVTRSSTLETRTNYAPTDCFETFPQPVLTHAVGKAAGALDSHRRQLMLDRWEGLTATYNRVHNPKEEAADIGELRRLHIELDHAVTADYGWRISRSTMTSGRLAKACASLSAPLRASSCSTGSSS